MPSPSPSNGHDFHPSVWHHLLRSQGSLSGLSPGALARGAPSAATVAAGDAGEVTAPRVDGHSVTAEDAANSSGGGGAHGSALWEGAEDGARKNHHHGGGLNDNGGVLALPDAGLIAAVGQRGRAAGLAWQALVVAGHVSKVEVNLGERTGGSRAQEHLRKSLRPHQQEAKAPAGWGGRGCAGGNKGLFA